MSADDAAVGALVAGGAAAKRQQLATNLQHEAYEVDTRDHEDHTFCGIMFDLVCKSTLPVDYVEINALWIRGELGPITVWVTEGGFNNRHEEKDAWDQVYCGHHNPSPNEFVRLGLFVPYRMKPGVTYGIYVHSTLPNDRAIVYDNQRHQITFEDNFVSMLPGLAHLSNVPFSDVNAWFGSWRRSREFVGRLEYGARYVLWNFDKQNMFPDNYRKMCAAFYYLNTFSR